MVKFHIDFDDRELENVLDAITKDLTEEEKKLVQNIANKLIDKAIKDLQTIKENIERPFKYPHEFGDEEE